MKYLIVVDSACDKKRIEEAKELKYERVPLILRVGDKEFQDDDELDVMSFLKASEDYEGASGSAAASPEAWAKAYEQADYSFAITITSALSGSYQSAVIGKEMLLEKYPDKKVHVIDSLSAGPGLTILVEEINRLVNEGLEFDEIVKKITEYQKKTHLLFLLESMDNLVKNGRVSALKAKMAGIFGIRILGIASKEGTLELLHKCRGQESALKKMVDVMKEKGYKGGRVIIGNCDIIEQANKIKDMLRSEFPSCEVEIMPCGGLCSFYAQRHGIMLGFEK